MILELADIRIHAGQQAAFDEAILRSVNTVISQARSFRGWKVNQGIESPERCILQIFWDTRRAPNRLYCRSSGNNDLAMPTPRCIVSSCTS